MPLFNVGFVIFPKVTQLDFTGPLQVLAGLPESVMHIVAKSETPVTSDCRLGLVPTHTFANCPPLDLICIPGGSEAVADVIGDEDTVEFVRHQAAGAKYESVDTSRRGTVSRKGRRGNPKVGAAARQQPGLLVCIEEIFRTS
jgi:putative intracellular protease/amidase